MELIRKIIKIAVISVIMVFIVMGIFIINKYKENNKTDNSTLISNVIRPNKPKYVRAIHLPAWVAGSKKKRQEILKLFQETELNTVVIAVKEFGGEVYIPGVKPAIEIDAYQPAIPDIKDFLQTLKTLNIYTVARISVFSDNILPRKKTSLAVKNPDGTLWTSYRGMTWLDPYQKEAWEYNFEIAEKCIEYGFEEIQFDYIRFPADGDTSKCRYSQQHSSITATKVICDFLSEANQRFKMKYGVNISIDVFGLTTSVGHDMGIGQNIIEMSKHVDFVCPMVYPSHYAKGEYGLKDPNREPYKTVYRSLRDAILKGVEPKKLRPYLQDFSLGYKYTAKEVLDQIQAAYDNDIPEWTLWDPNGTYTRDALKDKEHTDKYYKSVVSSSTVVSISTESISSQPDEEKP